MLGTVLSAQGHIITFPKISEEGRQLLETTTSEQMVPLLVDMYANTLKDQNKTNCLELLKSFMEGLAFLMA